MIHYYTYVFLAIFVILSAYPIYRALNPQNRGLETSILSDIRLDSMPAHIQKIVENNESVEAFLTLEMQNEHSRLLENLRTASNIPTAEWQDIFEGLKTVRAEDTVINSQFTYQENPQDEECIRKAKAILAQVGINPEKVNVHTYNEPDKKTNATSGQGYTNEGAVYELAINIPRFSQRTELQQELILKHEVQHLLTYDCLERAYIISCLKKHGIPMESLAENDAFRAYIKFQEFRADLGAAVKSLTTAQQFKQFFKDYIELNLYPNYKNGKSSSTHPTDEERYEKVSILVDYLEAEQKIKIS